jgi:Na+-driven multidrug efflux pump
VISVIATLINTFLNWVLIYGNWGPRDSKSRAPPTRPSPREPQSPDVHRLHGVDEAGLLRAAPRLLKVNVRIAAGILRKSGIIFLTEMTWAGTETVMTAVFNGRGGAEVVSGMSAGWAIANIFFLAFGAVHTSTGVIVGGTLGRNELDLARTQARWLRTGSIFLGLAVAAVEATSVLLIPIVFGNLSIDAQTVTTHFLWVISFYMPTWTFINAQFATARSGGDAIMGAWVDVTVNLAVLIPCSSCSPGSRRSTR